MSKKPSKDPTVPNSYRPICLTPNISKVYESIVNDKINNHVKSRQLLSDNQFGFRHKHSAVHAISKLLSDTCWHINKKEAVGACFIDLEKAFNKVWINGLIYKLKKMNFPEELLALITDMITDNSFSIYYGKNLYTQSFKIENGLQQGTINSPILFSLYLTELLELYSRINGPNYSIAFADDIVTYSAGDSISNIIMNAQKMFNLALDYCKVWKLKINTDKCETILFRNTIKNCNFNVKKHWKEFALKSPNNENLKKSFTIKYLGYKLHHRLSHIPHIKYVIEKSNQAFMACKKIFFNKKLNTRVKIISYQAFIRPIMSYAVPVWYNISASLMEELRKFERKCIRICTGKIRKAETNFQHYFSNKVIYNASNIPRFDSFCIKVTRNHYDRALKTHENCLISCVYYHNEDYIKKTLQTGFIAPEFFIYLDANKYIQRHDHVPLLYHYSRRATCKTIEFEPNSVENDDLKYDTYMSRKDKNISRNYWWLDNTY
jgi:hypothetical protein